MLDLRASVVFGWPYVKDDGIECCIVSDTVAKVAVASPKGGRFHKLNRPPSGRKRDFSSLDACRPAEHPLCLESLIQIDWRRGARDEDPWSDEFDDKAEPNVTDQFELILPKLLYRNDNANDVDRWHSLFPSYDYEIKYEDDQWAAAKRGDLEALKQIAGVDWSKEDQFESTALYYACHSGAARDLEVVQYLIQSWPGKIPSHVVDRCKKNAINASVVRLFENPEEDITLTKEQEDDIFNDSLQCLAGWNIFQEEEMECGEY